MVILTATQFLIMMGAVFVAILSAPYVVDYVFFVALDEQTWLGASIITAVMGVAFVTVTLKVVGL